MKHGKPGDDADLSLLFSRLFHAYDETYGVERDNVTVHKHEDGVCFGVKGLQPLKGVAMQATMKAFAQAMKPGADLPPLAIHALPGGSASSDFEVIFNGSAAELLAGLDWEKFAVSLKQQGRLITEQRLKEDLKRSEELNKDGGTRLRHVLRVLTTRSKHLPDEGRS